LLKDVLFLEGFELGLEVGLLRVGL
jgi:hypothetical protein